MNKVILINSKNSTVIASGAKQSHVFQIKSDLTRRYNNKDCFVPQKERGFVVSLKPYFVGLKDGALLAMTNETIFRGYLTS